MMELQREKAVKCMRPMTQVDILRRMEMCATKLKNEVQIGVAKAKAEKDIELSTAIARMAKEICNDINLDMNGNINFNLPPRSD